jgi:hemerythrin-like domain-containing protein
MKRSAALAPLSRDHHHALVVASALTRAGAGTCRSSATLFADFIAEHEARHFAVEEALLFPVLPPGDRAESLRARVRADHEYLREQADALRHGRLEPTVELTTSLGTRLRAHVQLEERELFPYIEQSLDAASLDRLGRQLEAGTSPA